MRTRLIAFVTFLAALWIASCGASTGGGGGGALYCGIGGACPTGFSCNSNNLCVPGGTDASIGDTGSKFDAEGKDISTQDSSPGVDTKIDVLQPDIVAADIFTPDVKPSEQTISAIEQAETSVNCTTQTSIADTASDVTLEPVVVTCPPTSLKNSTGTYFTSFFVAPQNGAASDGSWAGLQVIVNAPSFNVNVGDVLNIKGTVAEYYCMTEIIAAPADVSVSGTGAAPSPYGVQVSLFGGTGAEAFEGDLIQIKNVQVLDPNPVSTDGKTHGQASINHNGGSASVLFAPAFGSAFLGTSANGATTTFTAVQAFTSVTGNLQWSFGQWVIRARSDADLVL